MATVNYSDEVNMTSLYTPNFAHKEHDETNELFNFFLYKVTVPILFGIIVIVGATGNSLVIYVILSRERMRTVTNILLLNLAISDLAFVVVVPPSTAFQLVSAYWPFGDIACRLMHYLVNVFACVTVYTLVVVSGMRYLTIVHATSTARFRTRHTTVRLIAFLWTVLSIANIPVLLSYETKVNSSTNVTALGDNFDQDDDDDDDVVDDSHPECDLVDKNLGKPLFATLFTCGYLIPLSLIAVLSVLIVVNIRRQRAAVSDDVRRVRSARKKPVGRTLVMVVVLFAALWLPVYVRLLIYFFSGPTDSLWYEVASVVCHCLAYSNSCVNPFVYNHTSKDFRDSFRSVIQSTFRRRPVTGSSDRRHKRHRNEHHQIGDYGGQHPPSPDFDDETIANHRTVNTPSKIQHPVTDELLPRTALEPASTIHHVVTSDRDRGIKGEDDVEEDDAIDVVFSNSALLGGMKSTSEPIDCCTIQRKQSFVGEQRGYAIMTRSSGSDE